MPHVSDVAEYSWDDLQLVLDTAAEGAVDPEEMARWLAGSSIALPPSIRDLRTQDFGEPVPRESFSQL